MKLSNYDWEVFITVIGGRVTSFPVGYSRQENIPIIPYGPLARLIMHYYHEKLDRDIETVVASALADVWVIKARKLATEWDKNVRFVSSRGIRLLSR